MNMWKAATVVGLLAVSTALGTVTLTPVPASIAPMPAVGGYFNVDLHLQVDTSGDSPMGINGLSVFLWTDAPGAIQVTAVDRDPVLFPPIIIEPPVWLPYVLPGAPDWSSDFGFGGTIVTSYNKVLENFTFQLLSPVPSGTRINITSAWSSADDFSYHELPLQSVILTPEPASALLLAAVVVLLGRRRRR